MSRKITLYAVGALAISLAGCAAQSPVAVIDAAACGRRPANLVLSPRADVTYLATQLTERSDWPSTSTGYRFDEVTYYNRVGYDYQIGFDRYSAGYHGSDTITTGVWVR